MKGTESRSCHLPQRPPNKHLRLLFDTFKGAVNCTDGPGEEIHLTVFAASLLRSFQAIGSSRRWRGNVPSSTITVFVVRGSRTKA